MTHKKIVVFVIVIFVLMQQSINAQTNKSQQFLQNVGALDSIYSKTLNESRDIYIQLPDSYNAEVNKTYPVAYILDGELFLPIVSNVQSFYSGGFIPEMVLIGISNAKSRTRDLTTSKITSKYGMPFNEENGGAANFLKFIKEELVPYVESNYRVTNYRTLIGHSYGGLFGVYTLINDPDVFANYLCIDPSLDWDNQKVLKQAEAVLSKNDFSKKSLYVSLSGQLHMQNPNITIDNVMKDTTDFTVFSRSNLMLSNIIEKHEQNGLNYTWQFYANDIHGTIPLPSIKDGLLSTFKWFQMENTDKINSPETSKEDLFNIIKHREIKLKDHFGYQVPPYPEMLLNMSGYMNMEMGQLDKSKMYFELAVKYFPKSDNAYDSMADYYETQKDYKNALKYVTRAFELNSKDYYKKRIQELKIKK
ncbi:alpha/beta hydrolase-fold protein [Thalassobellus citreus]|uniref:alpha/beta hydrolase-fold protein n=1 Tax=Thalassobellus citreus TaxID=3367752 RepID=UPI0037B41EC3